MATANEFDGRTVAINIILSPLGIPVMLLGTVWDVWWLHPVWQALSPHVLPPITFAQMMALSILVTILLMSAPRGKVQVNQAIQMMICAPPLGWATAMLALWLGR